MLIREPAHDALQQVFELREETTIGGRGDGVDVASSPVAVVTWRDGVWWIRPLDPDTLVDDAPLVGEVALRHGQTIERRHIWRLRFLLGDRVRAREELRHVETFADGLTMLLNRRTAYAMLERMRAGMVMLADIDRLKQINDRCGMMAGDHTIRRTAAILRAHVAWPNLAARYGGEEFLVVMPDATIEAARTLAEQIRIAAEPSIVWEGERLVATLSIGLAPHTGDGTPALRAADEALGQAKGTGRNRVVG